MQDLWPSAPGKVGFRSDDQVLLCQCAPRSDCELELTESVSRAPAEAILPFSLGAKVARWEPLTHDVALWVVELDLPMHYDAGQFVLVGVDAPHYVCSRQEVEAGGMYGFQMGGGARVLLLRVEERFHAYNEVCPHEEVSLADGMFGGEVLTCHQYGPPPDPDGVGIVIFAQERRSERRRLCPEVPN
ncbi:MAG TPA: Rieske 2Fe-2S domain-containing protein [Ramlibacter sp.]|nr:Rieske 2Fe-2S domain-containing protein [Ramlibacter sp.]